MTEKKEGRVRKTLVSQVCINTRIRNLEVHRVLVSLHYRDQLKTTGSKTILPAPSVAIAPGVSSRGPAPPYCTHCGKRHKGDCWRLTDACLVYGSNEHKVKDFPRAHSFTAPQTGGITSAIQKGSKDNKRVASLNAPRIVTKPIGRQDSRAPARAYAMKAVEDKDAPNVIVSNINIFNTIVYALIDPSQPILMFVLPFLAFVVYRRVKPSMISW